MDTPTIRLVCPHCGCSDADLEDALWTDTYVLVVCNCCSKNYTVTLPAPRIHDPHDRSPR